MMDWLLDLQLKATDEIISAGKKLKIIGRAGAGIDNIDLNIC